MRCCTVGISDKSCVLAVKLDWYAAVPYTDSREGFCAFASLICLLQDQLCLSCAGAIVFEIYFGWSEIQRSRFNIQA